MKKKQKIVFKISKFDIRNYVNYNNFIITMTIIVMTIIGICYSLWEIPKFRSYGVIENQHYNDISNIVVNSSYEISRKTTNTLQEIEIMKTNKILSQVVSDLHLNFHVKPYLLSFFNDAYVHIKENFIFNNLYHDDYQNISLNNAGSYVNFVETNIPLRYLNKNIIIQSIQEKKYILQLPYGEKLIGIIGKKLFFDNENGYINIDKIYSPIGTKLILYVESINKTVENLKQKINIDIPKYIANAAKYSRNEQKLIEVSYVDRNMFKATAIVNSILNNSIVFDKKNKEDEAANLLKILYIQRNLVSKNIFNKNKLLAKVKYVSSPLDYRDESQYLLKELSELSTRIRILEQQKILLLETVTKINPQFITVKDELEMLYINRNKLQSKIHKLPFVLQKANELENEIYSHNKVLMQLDYQIQQLQAIKKSAISNLKIIQSAEVPTKNINHDKLEVVVLSIVIGALIGYILSLVIT